MSKSSKSEVLEVLDLLHRAVEQITGQLTQIHAGRLNCAKGCASCCVDDLSVFEVEAAKIERDHAEFLAKGIPHAPGGCVFLDLEGSCRIYESRPYVCRTQGLPLRWVEEVEGQWQEWRDICPLNEGEGLEGLEPQECWTLGAVEQKLRELNLQLGRGEDRRVLRSMMTG